jgi:hypothetical protein
MRHLAVNPVGFSLPMFGEDSRKVRNLIMECKIYNGSQEVYNVLQYPEPSSAELPDCCKVGTRVFCDIPSLCVRLDMS